jgi:hypothetical protein
MVFFVFVLLWSCASLMQQMAKVLLAKNYKLFMSTTMASLLLGIGLACAYIATNRQEDAYILIVLQFAFAAILIGWLFGLLLLFVNNSLRFFSDAFTGTHLWKGYLADEGPEWDKIRIRREMIALRLGVDDPCNCSKRRITCDYWSLCDGSPYSRINHSAIAPGYVVNLMKKNEIKKPTVTKPQKRKNATTISK